VVCSKLSAKAAPVNVMPRPIAIIHLLSIAYAPFKFESGRTAAEDAAGLMFWFTSKFSGSYFAFTAARP
jgi:hypothetical protein